ncbi:MAG: hypothetical protein RL716_788 [Actinomycetota bacterium]|jgi:hypothetical protein|uniref:DUF4233 domain-containing protein n=1 Tax=Rhodoluna sp. TaxID=1969481 RepID=UPI0025DC9197|nr:DUF4233 domain-containing protein [Rhodoluna sp.]
MRKKSTQRTLGSMLLAFESFVVFFATLVAFGLKVADGPVVWAIGLSLAFILIATPAILGRKFSYVFGWFLQLVVVALGIWVPLMYVVGAIFVCLWAWAMIAGSTIDKARAVFEKNLAAGQTLEEEQ